MKRYADARTSMAAALAQSPTPETRANLEAFVGNIDRYLEAQKKKAEREAQKPGAGAAKPSKAKGRKG